MLNISDFALFSCFPGARLDLSAEDNVVALALAECPTCPYAELIRLGIPGPSNLRSARSTASRPLPPSTMGVSPIRLTVATHTRGEILVQLGALSRKPRSTKRKKSSSTEKDRPVFVKIKKLRAPPTSLARKPERAQSPPAEAPVVTRSPPLSKPVVEAKSLLGGAVEQPLDGMPITVWNSPSESARPPPRRLEELKRKNSESKVGEDEDSFLFNAELAVGAISSVLKDSDLGRSKALPVDEALALSLQGVASVSPCVRQCLFPF